MPGTKGVCQYEIQCHEDVLVFAEDDTDVFYNITPWFWHEISMLMYNFTCEITKIIAMVMFDTKFLDTFEYNLSPAELTGNQMVHACLWP